MFNNIKNNIVEFEDGFLDNQHDTITSFSAFFSNSKIGHIPDKTFNDYPNLTSV